MVKGVVNDSSHEITKIYHDGREIERVCDIYGNVLYLSSKTVTGAASLSFKNRKESTRNVVGFRVETSSSDIESINAFMLSKFFIAKQISTSYFGVYLPEPGSYEITLVYTGQTYNFVSDGDVNTYFFIDLGYGAVVNRDIDIYVEKQDGQFDFTKVKYAVFDTIYYDDRYDILNEHPVRFDNSIESYSIYGNNLNGVHVGDYDENSGKYMLPISIHGKNLFNVEDFFSSSINVVRGNMRFYEQTQEQVVGVLIQAENNDCYTMPYYQMPCKPGQYYTLSWYSDNNNPGLVYIFFYDSDGIKISQVYANNANSKQLTFLVPENAAITKLRLGIANAGSNIAYTNIQLERGQTKTNYISYQDPVIHTVSLDEPLRKIGNELEYIQKRKSVTNGILHRVTQKTSNTAPLTFASTGQALKHYRIYGNAINGENVGDRTGNLCNIIINSGKVKDELYLTVNPDKTIVLDGVANSTAVIHISEFITAGHYYISGCPEDGSSSSFQVLVRDRNNINTAVDNGTGIQINTSSDFDICIRVAANYNCDHLIFYPLVSVYDDANYEPYGYRVPVTVEGKNLLLSVASSQATDEGTTFTRNDDGSISVNANGTSSSLCIYRMGCVLDAGDYILTGRPTDKSVNGIRQDIYWAGVDAMVESGSGLNFTIDADHTKVTVRIIVSKNTVVNNVTFYPMIRKADIEDSAYEPYHDPINTNIYLPNQIKMVGDEAEYADYQEQKLHRVRKNLLRNTASSQTKNGVTFTVNNDGSVTCNGTASNNTFFKIGDLSLASQSYILTGCPSNGGNDSYTLRCYKNGNVKGADVGNGFNINESIDGYIEIRIASGYTCDSLTFYPMIRKADIEDDTYEPYIENTELDAELPELQTVEGTNTLSIRTAVQPSQVLVEAMYPNDSYILTPEISTFEDINTITVNTEIPPESISITGKIGPIS